MNVKTVSNYGDLTRKPIRKILRKACITTAVAGGILSAASLVKTPHETLNPKPVKCSYYYVDNKYPASSNLLFPFYEFNQDFRYNPNKSIIDNAKYNLDVANDKLFFNVIDPIAEKPVIPFTATALALLGVIATKPKDNTVEQMEEARTEFI